MGNMGKASVGELEHLQDVSVGVLEGGYPAAPVFLLRGTQELHPCRGQALVFPVDVLHSQVGHHPERVPAGAAHAVMDADVEAHVRAQLEGDEVAMVGMQGQLQQVVVEPVKAVQVVRSRG